MDLLINVSMPWQAVQLYSIVNVGAKPNMKGLFVAFLFVWGG